MHNFDSNRYKYWTSYILEHLSLLSVWTGPFIFVTLLFLAGFFITMGVDFHYQYVTTFAIYVCLFGILYAFIVAVWMPQLYIDKLVKVGSLFSISNKKYYSLLDKWLSRQCNNKISLGWAFIGASVTSLIANLFGPHAYSHSWLRFLRFLPLEWYRDSYLTKLLSGEILWFFVVALIITGSRALVLNIFLMKELSALKVALSPKLTEIGYKSLANVNLLIFSNWCVGAALFIVAAYKIPNIIAIIMTILLSLIGLLTFCIPQYYLYRNLRNVKEQLINMIKQVYKNDSHLIAWHNISSSSMDFVRMRRIHSFNQMAEAANNIRPGLYNVQFLLIFLSSALIPVLTLIAKLLLKPVF